MPDDSLYLVQDACGKVLGSLTLIAEVATMLIGMAELGYEPVIRLDDHGKWTMAFRPRVQPLGDRAS